MAGPCFSVNMFAQVLLSDLKGRNIFGILQSSPLGGTVSFVTGWLHAENSGSINGDNMCVSTAYNPLGYEDVSGKFVAFPSLQAGAQAVATRLQHGNPAYAAFAHALATDDLINLAMAPGADGSYKMANNVALGLAMWVHGNTDVAGAQGYINNILKAAGQAHEVTIGDLVGGNINSPSGQFNTDPLASIGNLFTTISNLMSNPTRLIKGVIGLVLFMFGIGMAVHAFAPESLKQAVKLAAIA
jgi:hypothetical protein